MNAATVARLAETLREAVAVLGCLHASNTNALAADARAALADYDRERADLLPPPEKAR